MSEFVLVTGGARSGKSSFAELLAKKSSLPVTYIATAQIWDEEMEKRVQKHRLSRPTEWGLIEEPLLIQETLLTYKDFRGVILLDCVTLWLSNLLLEKENKTDSPAKTEINILEQVKKVADTAKAINPFVIFVTNEVGQGIVPENPLARAYRDLAGRSNQILASAADAVYLVVAGYPIEVKQSGQQILNSLK